jgi:hypothetical protein
MPAAADRLRSNRGEPEQQRDLSMNVVWILVGIGIFGVLALAKRIAWPHKRGAQSDLGFVSHQWLAEHRLSQISDSQR